MQERYAKEFLTSNPKSIYLQSSSITIAIIKTELFKSLEIEYFYLDLSKDTHLLDNYIIFKKNVFYYNIYMFTQ